MFTKLQPSSTLFISICILSQNVFADLLPRKGKQLGALRLKQHTHHGLSSAPAPATSAIGYAPSPQPDTQPDSDSRKKDAWSDEDDHEDFNSNSGIQMKVHQLIEQKLGASYDKRLRPLPDKSAFEGTHRIKVTVGLKLVKLIKVDQIEQKISLAVWVRLMWPDYRLKYNASEYFGDTHLHHHHTKGWDSENQWIPVEQDMVWVPEIPMYDSVEPPVDIWRTELKPRVFWYDEVKLKKHGYNMVLVSPEVVTINCVMKLAAFPFDEQVCNIQLGGWSASDRYFDIGHVDLQADHAFRDDDTEFDVVPMAPERTDYHDQYLAGNQAMPSVDYVLKLSRRPNFYLLIIVLPMFLLVLFGQALYWMDMGKERLSTGITVVLAVMAVAFLTEPLMPKTQEVLWIEKFQVGCYILTCFPLFFSILLDHLRQKGYLTEQHSAKVDSVCRVVHPVAVLCFYFTMFGVPGFRTTYGYFFGHPSFWPFEIPTIRYFFAAELFIFCLFFGVAVLDFTPLGRKAEEEIAKRNLPSFHQA